MAMATNKVTTATTKMMDAVTMTNMITINSNTVERDTMMNRKLNCSFAKRTAEITHLLAVATTTQMHQTLTTMMAAITRVTRDTRMTIMMANTMIKGLQDSNTKVKDPDAAATIQRKIRRHLATSP